MGYRDQYQEQRFSKKEKGLIVSFDFDSTLSRPEIQNLCRSLVAAKKYIVTTRSRQHDNKDLYHIAEKVEIPRNQIYFTEFEDKAPFLKGIDFHFDDDPHEIEMIMSANNGCTPIYLPKTITDTYQLP